MIVDGADNFPTRYLVNDASVWSGIPVVHGSIFRFEGQVTVFQPGVGPCYRCLFPQPPPPELAPSCAEGGVLGVLPGIIGSIQANETLKLVLGRGDPLAGRLLLFDALATTLRRGDACAATPTARSAATARRSPSTSTTSSSATGAGAPLMAAVRHPADAPRRGRWRSASSRRTATRSREVIDDLVERYPPLGAQLLQDGELAPFVNVYVGGEDVRTRDGLDTDGRAAATS